MTLEEIKAYLEENKDKDDVKAYLGELSAVSAEKVEGFLDTAEGKKLLQPRLDRNFTTGLNTWKENNLDTLIEDEVKKRNPDETPEQKRIRELEEKIEKQEKNEQRSKLKEAALAYATEKGVDAKFSTKYIHRFLEDDESTTNATLDEFKTDLDAMVQSQVDAKFKGSGKDFNLGGGDKPSAINISELAKEASIRE